MTEPILEPSRSLVQRVLPIALLLLGFLGAVALVQSRETVTPEPPTVVHPLIRFVRVTEQRVSLDVTALGTVLPRTETTLAAQLAAEVVSISPSFETGGFVERDEVLIRLDSRDYQLAIERAGAQVAQARLRLTREEAEARVAAEEWRQLGEGEADPLTLREPQQAEARAALTAAEAELGQARLDLERTYIRAPFTGRIRQKMVDLGQYLTPGHQVATLHAIDFAEVRLPVADQQLAFLDLPLTYRNGEAPTQGPEALLSARFTGRRYDWRGYIVRTEGELDRRSRMMHLVARVEDPYGRGGGEPRRPPLAVGLFVEARIAGRTIENARILPLSALRGQDQVLLVDDEDRLRFRTVDLVRIQGEHIIVDGGLEAGERVCVSQLDEEVDGMQVRTVETEVEELPKANWQDFEDKPRLDGTPHLEEAPHLEDAPHINAQQAADQKAAIETSEARPEPTPGRLLQATISGNDQRLEVELHITAPFQLETHRFRSPERFVIDLLNTVNESPRAQTEAEAGPVERLRISQFQASPVPVTRVVFDLLQASEPTLTRTEQGLTVSFDSGGG